MPAFVFHGPMQSRYTGHPGTAAVLRLLRADPQSVVALTPRGVLHAFGDHDPTPMQRTLQTVLQTDTAPTIGGWVSGDAMRAALLEEARERGWAQCTRNPSAVPSAATPEIDLPSLLVRLSDNGRAAIASGAGSCLAHAGYSSGEANAMCGAAADVLKLVVRQRSRRGRSRSRAVSFFGDEQVQRPDTTFVPLWVGSSGFCLVVDGEPLLNNRALVGVIGALVSATRRDVSVASSARASVAAATQPCEGAAASLHHAITA